MPKEHSHSPSTWPLYTAAGFGAFIVSPYVLPYLGIGKVSYAETAMGMLHTGELGTGLVKSINELLSHIPLIGSDLATGSIVSVATSALLGIGGVLLANWMEGREKTGDFPWSKVVRYAALGSSLLIALPSILTSISLAATFFGLVHSDLVGKAMADVVANTIGGMGTMKALEGGAGLLAVTLPHLLTCGAAIIPPALAMFMSGKAKETSQPSTQVDERAQTMKLHHAHGTMR